jgi:hypothetical protein
VGAVATREEWRCGELTVAWRCGESGGAATLPVEVRPDSEAARSDRRCRDGSASNDCRNGLILACARHRPGQPIRARCLATEQLTSGSQSSVNFSK